MDFTPDFFDENSNTIRFTTIGVMFVSAIVLLISITLLIGVDTALRDALLTDERRAQLQTQRRSFITVIIICSVVVVLSLAMIWFLQDKGELIPPPEYYY